MQGQYGAATDKRLRDIMREMWSEFGFRKGVMRGYWVSLLPFVLTYGVHDSHWCSVLYRIGYGRQRDPGICWVSRSRSRYRMHAAVVLMMLVQVLHGCDYIQK